MRVSSIVQQIGSRNELEATVVTAGVAGMLNVIAVRISAVNALGVGLPLDIPLFAAAEMLQAAELEFGLLP